MLDNKYILMEGDCIKNLEKIKDKSIDMIFADPPYKLSNDGITCENGKMVSVNKGEWDKSEGLEEDYKFNEQWIKACDRVLKDDGTMWISGTYHIIHTIGYILIKMGYYIINEVIWAKPNAAPNLGCRCFTASQETLLWVKKSKKAKHIFNYEEMKSLNEGKQMRSVWEIPTTAKNEKSWGKHPTQKPKELLKRCILASTNIGDIILDPFSGSGTTGVVAIQEKRCFIGLERDKKYLELSEKRINELINDGEQINIFEKDNNIKNLNIENILKDEVAKLEEKKMRPFLKWAGGKTQLLDEIVDNLPNNIEERSTYIEPFIGAGAVFFKFLEEDKFEKYIINDINEKLINLYTIIRDEVELLIENLSDLKERFLKLEEEEKKEFYYGIRDKFNSDDIGRIELASHFIFLNKTCFNGLYRENAKGGFNVPMGSYKSPSIFEEEHLREVSKLLNKRNEDNELRVTITNGSYVELKEYINRDTFVYMDPPYRPVTKGGFSTYDKSGFNDESQIKLSEFFRECDETGACLMLSNSDPKNLDEEDNFFDDLYNGFDIKRVQAGRSINSKGAGRGKITELIIRNYEV